MKEKVWGRFCTSKNKNKLYITHLLFFNGLFTEKKTVRGKVLDKLVVLKINLLIFS